MALQSLPSNYSEVPNSKEVISLKEVKDPISTNQRLKSFPNDFSHRTLKIGCSANDPSFITLWKAINKLLRGGSKLHFSSACICLLFCCNKAQLAQHKKASVASLKLNLNLPKNSLKGGVRFQTYPTCLLHFFGNFSLRP